MVKVFEGTVTGCDCEPTHYGVPCERGYHRSGSLLACLEDLDGKRVRVTVEVLDEPE